MEPGSPLVAQWVEVQPFSPLCLWFLLWLRVPSLAQELPPVEGVAEKGVELELEAPVPHTTRLKDTRHPGMCFVPSLWGTLGGTGAALSIKSCVNVRFPQERADTLRLG